MLAARKAYALRAVEVRRCMVELQKGKELVPHSQLNDLILLIHQGMRGWEAESGAIGSDAQRQCLHNQIARGLRDDWETELLRAAAAGAIRITGSRADTSGRWRLAVTDMVLSGCQLQKLGKEHCKERREAFWARLNDLRLLGKIFGAWGRVLLRTTVQRAVGLRSLRLESAHIVVTTQLDGYERRRLRKAVERQRAAIVEEKATSTPAEWLRMRVWVAWRIILAQGKGRSGRRICHGAGRHHLRELLYEAALGVWREFPVAPTSLMDLRFMQRWAWRRWLRTGGWGEYNLNVRRQAQLSRNRALAVQREGMRRWACLANGLRWQILTEEEVEERFELVHEGLRAILEVKQTLSAGEWRALGICNLRMGHFVRVGQGPAVLHFGPEAIEKHHTLSGQPAEEVGDVIHIEIEPRVNPQRNKRRRQEVARSRRDTRQRVAMAPVVAGREADDGGRWAVRRIMAVRRHDGRRGRPLDVLVEWEGEDSDGDMWEESWVSVSYLSADLRAEARRLEAELFGPRVAQAGPASRRATRRVAARQRQERERDVQQWRSRLRDRAPPPPIVDTSALEPRASVD